MVSSFRGGKALAPLAPLNAVAKASILRSLYARMPRAPLRPCPCASRMRGPAGSTGQSRTQRRSRPRLRRNL
eukprot:8960122-Alexandrium_andersonii.AAC.1